MNLMPCRDGELLQSRLSTHPQKVFTYDDAIGMVVSPYDNSIQGNSNSYIDEKPVIENQGKLLKDTMNWLRVSGSFNARGQEKYIVIGNFRENDKTKVDLNGRIPPTGGYPANMFFIDDVLISEFDPLPDTAILCADAPLVFDATFYDATYRWSDFSENNKLVVTKPGTYWVQARIDGVLLQDEVMWAIPLCWNSQCLLDALSP